VDKFLATTLIRLEQLKRDRADDAMRFPKADPFEHGTQVGTWAGLENAIQLINAIYADGDDET